VKEKKSGSLLKSEPLFYFTQQPNEKQNASKYKRPSFPPSLFLSLSATAGSLRQELSA